MGTGQPLCEVSDSISACTCPTQIHSVPIPSVALSSLTLVLGHPVPGGPGANQPSLELSVLRRQHGWGREMTGEMSDGPYAPHPGPRGGGDLREVAAELQLAAAGPVEAVEGSLHQGRHDAAQAGLVGTAVPLTIVLHAEPRGGGRQGRSRHAQGSHPWEDRQVAGNGGPCSDQASDCASWPQFRIHAAGRTTSWREAEALLCPSIGPDSLFPESLAPAVLYSQTLCLLLKPYPYLHSLRGQLKPQSCPGHLPWLPSPWADLTQQKPPIPPSTARMP